MNHQKYKQQTSQYPHASAIPFAVLLRFINGISNWPGLLILKIEQIGLNDMENNSRKQNDLHKTYDHIGTHKMGRQIEGFPTVVKKDHRIYRTMHDQESDQEQSGNSHH